MAIPFPDILEHNNPNNPLMDVNQLEGVSIIDLLTERDIIPIAKRKGGHFVISKTKEKAYIYTGTTLNDIDWDNASNWTECGGIGLSTLPASQVSVATVSGFTATEQQTFDEQVASRVVTLETNETPPTIGDTDNVRFKSATGYYNRTLSAIKNYILTGLSATNVALTPALWFVSTNVQAFAGEIAGRVLSATTAEKTTLIDADSVGIWDSTSSLFKRTTLLTISNFFSTKYFSDVWDLSLDNGNILIKGHITNAGTFAIKVRYKFYQNTSDVSVKLFPATVSGGNWVRFEVADFCRSADRAATNILAFTITNFYSTGSNYIGSNFSNIAGAGSVTENQQDDGNTYLESTPRALYSDIDFIVDHTNTAVSEEAWGIVHLTGTIL